MMQKSDISIAASLLTKVKASPVAPARPVRPTPENQSGPDPAENHGKTMGKPWENGGLTKKHWDFMAFHGIHGING